MQDRRFYKEIIVNISAISFALPAIVFWALFAYSGSSLEGFLTLLGFILDGYNDATIIAKKTFISAMRYALLTFTSFLVLITILLTIGRKG